MADRKQFLKSPPVDSDLKKLLEDSRKTSITEEELREQRISFAYGNALGSKDVTKNSVRRASENILLIR